MVFTCRQTGESSSSPDEYVMKIKVQYYFVLPEGHTSPLTTPNRIPGTDQRPSKQPLEGPSTTTASELRALETFRNTQSPYAPQLFRYKRTPQGSNGPLPGGYLTFTVMTKMPGDSLHNLYFWGMGEEEREDIKRRFLVALR